MENHAYRWFVFAWAVLTAAAVFPLIALGGVVTSLGIGMADPEPVRVPWYMLLTSVSELAEEKGWHFVIENSHRFVGWIVGVMVIVQALLLLAFDPRRAMKVMGIVALLMVGVQGVLGMFRVALESAGLGLEIAMVHGVLGPMTFAVLCAIALMTARSWWRMEQYEVEDAERFRRVSRLTTLMVLLQLIAGVWLRQIGLDAGFVPLLIHLFLALAVVAHVLMLWMRVGRWRTQPSVISRPVQLALILMGLQVLLGVAAWVYGGGVGARNKALAPVGTELAVSSTAHVALGALLLAVTLLVALRAARHLARTELPQREHEIATPVGAGGAR
jgi:cytochrome c oxidase assembly protein subunit 15